MKTKETKEPLTIWVVEHQTDNRILGMFHTETEARAYRALSRWDNANVSLQPLESAARRFREQRG